MSNEYGRKNIGRTNEERRGDKETRKALFLKAFREIGTRSGAFRIAEISKATYDRWIWVDPDFMRKVSEAQVEFGEYLEEIALERVKNPDKNRGSDVLLLGLLNANLPTKFRPQFAMSEDSAKDLIIEWRKAARDRVREEKVKEPEALPASVEKTLTELLEKRRNAPEQEA
jgi:hypothetical protein